MAGAWFGANRLWGGKRKWGGRLVQAGRQATVRRDVEGVADVGEQAENLSVGGVLGGPAGEEVLPVYFALLPVVKDLLSEELSAAAVEEVVEDAEEVEGALEEEVDEGPVDGLRIIRMFLVIMGGRKSGRK